MAKCRLSSQQLLNGTPTDIHAYHWHSTGGDVIQYKHKKYLIDSISYGTVDYVTHVSAYLASIQRWVVLKKIYGDAAKKIYEHARRAMQNQK